MRKPARITPIDKTRLSARGRNRLYAAEKLLRDTATRLKLQFPELGYALSRMTFVPVKEKIGVSTDGLNILYHPDYVLCAGFPETAERLTAPLKTGEMKLHSPDECLLHIILHGILRHFEIRNSYSADRMLFFRLTDLQVDHFLREMYRPSADSGDRAEAYTEEYPELKELFTGLDFPLSVYMDCLKDRRTAFAVKTFSTVAGSDNHYLWYLRDQENNPEKEADGNSDDKEDASGDDTKDAAPGRRPIPVVLLPVHLPEVSDKKVAEFWKAARVFATGKPTCDMADLFILAKGHGNSRGDSTLAVTAAAGEGLSYHDLLREFFHLSEGGYEDPESLDYSLYQYGLQLYEDVPLVEPADETLYRELGVLVIAMDTSGSCSGSTASVFLRETRKLLSDIEEMGRFQAIHLLECDTRIANTYRLTTASDLDQIRPEMILHGYGGTDFRPVFQYADELEKNGETVSALIYLSDSYGDFPEEERKNTFFVMEKSLFDKKGNPRNRDFPKWITPVRLE